MSMDLYPSHGGKGEPDNMSVKCGGCRDLGAHVRWCPEVVGVRASRLGLLSEKAEALGDEIGPNCPEAANRCYTAAALLRKEATR